MTDDWYSDAALDKQRQAQECQDRHEQTPASLLFGILEPRVPPTAEERCNRCGTDARGRAGGAISHGVRWCSLCLDRRRDDDYEATS